MSDVIGIGSVFIDYFFEVDSKLLNKYHLKPEDDFLFREVKITPKEIFDKLPYLSKSPGGISLNTIAVLGSMNINVSYYGLIGNDKEGKYFFDNLHKVEKSHLVKTGNMSRCACLLSHSRKHRTFLSEVNKNDDKFFENVNFKFLNNAKFVHVGPFLLNTKKSLKKLEKIFSKINKPLISFSPSILYINFGFEMLIPLLKKTYILFLNEQEIEKLTNKNPKEGSKYLLNFGPKIVICTLGKKGALVTTSRKQIFRISKKIKKIIDTTGAGDSFAAGFLYGILKQKSLKECLIIANKIASKAVSDFGLKWLGNISN